MGIGIPHLNWLTSIDPCNGPPPYGNIWDRRVIYCKKPYCLPYAFGACISFSFPVRSEHSRSNLQRMLMRKMWFKIINLHEIFIGCGSQSIKGEQQVTEAVSRIPSPVSHPLFLGPKTRAAQRAERYRYEWRYEFRYCICICAFVSVESARRHNRY